MEMTIKSRRLAREITFSRPGSGYIFCDMGHTPLVGSLGAQICEGGRISGSTLSYRGDDPKAFRRICRAWWRAYLRRLEVMSEFLEDIADY
jgi:hypothetical protein